MKLKTILEEVAGSAKIQIKPHQRKWFNIYLLTPQHYKEDLKKAQGENSNIRFIASLKNKEVYAFSTDLTHWEAETALKLDPTKCREGYAIEINGEFFSNKWIQHWDWVNKYIKPITGFE
jgi:hypothetical protein